MSRPIPTLLPRPMLALVTAVLVAAGAAAFMSASTAYAEIEGPCEATIAGVPVGPLDSGDRGDDIAVSEHDQVVVTATSTTGFESHKVQLEFAGQRWTVSDQEDDGSTSWSDTVNVDDYATWGVGLYKVIGVSTLTNGESCEGAATVDVGGNPLTTVAGGVAAVGTVAAVGGAAATTVRSATRGGFDGMVDMVEGAFNEERQRTEQRARPDVEREAITRQEPAARFFFLPWLFGWCVLAIPFVLLLPVLALAGGGDEPRGTGGESGEPPSPSQPSPEPAGKRPGLPKPPWTPRITLVGLLSGFIGGVGAVVLMQQYSIEYPTLAVVLRTVIVTTIVGGLVLPTIGQTVAWFRARSKIQAWERELGWRD